MRRVPRDQNGLRFYTENDIEERAKRFLETVAPQCLARPLPLPIFRIVRQLEGKGWFRYVPADLGEDFLGAYSLRRKILYVHSALLESDPRLSFTVAHELGHFYLHSKLNPAIFRQGTSQGMGFQIPEAPDQSDLILDGPREIILGRLQTDNPRSIAEWQANRFAGAILIPRVTLRSALELAQQHIGINRHLGTIWLTNQRGSYVDFRTLIRILAERYQTSQAVMKIRLYSLGLVREDGVPIPLRRLGDVIGETLNNLFTGRG